LTAKELGKAKRKPKSDAGVRGVDAGMPSVEYTTLG